MNKKKLVEFINKYNVAKNEQVIINSNENILKVESKPTDIGGLRISVALKDSGVPEGSFGILETKKFKSMLSIMNDEVNITLNKNTIDAITSISFKDSTNKEVSVVTADLSVLEKIDPIKGLPEEYPVILPITNDFIKDFSTAVTSLGIKLFSLNTFEDILDVELLFGYRENINTDTIKIPLKNILTNSKYLSDCSGTFSDVVYYDAESFLEILNVNKDIASFGKLMFSEDLIRMEFESPDFTSQYLLVAAEV